VVYEFAAMTYVAPLYRRTATRTGLSVDQFTRTEGESSAGASARISRFV
jgi:hypothetical protein